jgi:hypothetical protein
MSLKRGLYRNVNYSIVLFLIFLCFSCGINRNNDVYKKFPLGSTLNDSILKGSIQIIPHNLDLILLYDISNEWNVFSPHLLFYDSTLKFYASSFFPSDKIDSIKNNVINAVVFEERMKRRKLFRNDLPLKYDLNLCGQKSIKGNFNKSNKIVEKIIFDHNSDTLTLYIRKSDDIYYGVGYRRSPDTDSIFFNNVTKQDTIQFSLADVLFDFKRGVIKRKYIESDTLIREEMILLDNSILTSFYHQIKQFYKGE